jgi:hypothetical protein
MQRSISRRLLDAVVLLPAAMSGKSAATWTLPGFAQSEPRNDARREYIRLNSRMAAA